MGVCRSGDGVGSGDGVRVRRSGDGVGVCRSGDGVKAQKIG